MSSSEDEAVRRPGRGGRAYNDNLSDDEVDSANASGKENGPRNGNDEDDDKDLFGSGSDPDQDEWVSFQASNSK